MDQKHLQDSAQQLLQPSIAARDEYTQNKAHLADLVIKKLFSRDDLIKLIGENNQEMLKDNVYNMARFMESIFTNYHPNVLVETILWVFRAYRSHGFQLTFWSAHLNIWMDILSSELSNSTYAELKPFYNWMQINIPVFTHLTDT